MADITIATIILVIITGILPTFLWIWFWFTQDRETDNFGFLSLLYLLGMLSVPLLLPFRKIVFALGIPESDHLLIFAAAEEIVKVGIVAVIAFRAKFIKKPTDYTLYLVTFALGLSALENALYLITPVIQQNITLVLFTGNLRFIGATLLHTVCVGIAGILIGMSYYEKRFVQWIHGIFGLGIAIGLHAVFNYFIIESTVLSLIGLWVIGCILFLLYRSLQKKHRYRETEYSHF